MDRSESRSPLTVAGTAAEWDGFPREPHSRFQPFGGTGAIFFAREGLSPPAPRAIRESEDNAKRHEEGRNAIAGRGSGRGTIQPLRQRQGLGDARWADIAGRSEEHTSELESLMRISYAVFCLKKKTDDSNRAADIQMTTKS